MVRADTLSGLFGIAHTHATEDFQIRQETDLGKPTLKILENLPPEVIFYNLDFSMPLKILVFSVKTENEGCEIPKFSPAALTRIN